MFTLSRQACSNQYPLSQASLLALLPSDIDKDFVIEVATGKTVSIDGISANTVTANVNNGVWERIEHELPRKWLVNSTSRWKITSFDPRTGLVCISYRTEQGELRNYTVKVIVYRNGNT